MDYQEIRRLLEEIQNDLYFHEEATTSDKQVEAQERIEASVDNLKSEVFDDYKEIKI